MSLTPGTTLGPYRGAGQGGYQNGGEGMVFDLGSRTSSSGASFTASITMLRLIIDVLLNAGLLYVIAALLPGVRLKSFGTAVAVAIVYGLLSYFLFWVIALITFIPMLLSFGLFGLVINTFLLWLTDQLLDDFEIRSLGMTFLMALLLTVGKIALRVIL